MTETLQSPIWILETTNYKGVGIALVVVQIPNHIIFHMTDMAGNFDNGIIHPIQRIIFSLRGEIESNILISKEFFDRCPEFPVNNEEIILVNFQKNYCYSTRNVSFFRNENVQKQLPEISNNIWTNRIFKEAKVLMKYNLQIVVNNDRFDFQLDGTGTTNFTQTEIDDFKSKLMVH